MSPVPMDAAPARPEPTCSTCKRTRLGEGSVYCSDSFHLPDEFRYVAPVPEDREEATGGVAAMVHLIASYRKACEEWGATSADAWLERVAAGEEALTARVGALEEDNQRLRGDVEFYRKQTLEIARQFDAFRADHGHTEGPNG